MLVTLDELNYTHHLSFVRPKRNVTRPAANQPPKVKTDASVAVTTGPVKLIERKIQKISEIFFSSDSLQLSFFDNGTVDGDTVSMVLDGRVIAEKIKLTTNAYRITIPTRIDLNDSMMLVMHAESLGLIPPNTGLLIIQDGTTRHEIRFEGDLQRSSAVILRKKR